MQFSEEELQHLFKAWAAISLAFAIVFARGFPFFGVLSTFLLSGLTVGISFIIHELAHKFMAQKYGCWAEFRASNTGLLLAVVMAWIGGIVFAAPGAVMISGLAAYNEKKNGKIAAVGPVSNLLLALLFTICAVIFKQLGLSSFRAGISIWLMLFFSYGVSVNSWLAFFNLLPFGIMDGWKIKEWNLRAWLVLLFIAGVMVFVVNNRLLSL